MKRAKMIYWIITGLMVAMLGVGAVFDAISAPEAVKYITDLGYPAYIAPFLGVAKILGIIAVLIPGYPRLKEWAYAGLAFDVIGALYSHICVGEPVSSWSFIFLPLGLIAGSYIFYHKLRSATTSREIVYTSQS